MKKEESLREDPSKDYIFVIPDINGEVGMVETLVNMIKSGKYWPIAKNDTVLFMGQYVGENTKETINYIKSLENKLECDVVCLTGPDDFRFMKSREQFFDSDIGKLTINSYRLYKDNKNHFRHNAVEADDILAHRAWLQTLNSFYVTSKFFFCYGGINPSLPLLKQSVGGIMFNHCNKKISTDFKQSTKDFEKIIVHSGYIPQTAKPFIKKSSTGKINRINVNTNTAVTGLLTCSVLDNTTGELVTTFSVWHPERYKEWCKNNNIPFHDEVKTA